MLALVPRLRATVPRRGRTARVRAQSQKTGDKIILEYFLLRNRVRHRGQEWSLARIRRAYAAAMRRATTAAHPSDTAS